MNKIYGRMHEDVGVYFCSGCSGEIGYFKKAGTEVMRGKPHTWCGKVQPFVANTKER